MKPDVAGQQDFDIKNKRSNGKESNLSNNDISMGGFNLAGEFV